MPYSDRIIFFLKPSIPLPFFLPVTQNYHEAPIPKNSCKPFCCGYLYEKKIKKFSFTSLSEHFEIWVWKPNMDARVKNLIIDELVREKLIEAPCNTFI